jgi:type IV pilus assembly protein PilW
MKNSGFTLLEIVITTALVAIVMAIAVPSMTTFAQNDRLTTQINTLLGHLAYARSEAVKRSQQVAVCVSNNTTSCTGGTSWQDGWIVYTDINGDSAFTADEEVLRAMQVLKGSNTLTLRGGKPGQTNVESPFLVATDQRLYTDTINTIGGGDIILVARCGTNDLLVDAEADILAVDSVVPGINALQRLINIGADKSQQFENDSIVIELQTVTYSIAAGASGEPALFRSEFGDAQELVEGVENLQVLYGVDSDSDDFPNQYVTSNKVIDFEDVVALRIDLLMRSLNDFVTDDPQTYSFNGVQTTPADRRIRQVFSTTIALRNRIGAS